MDLQDDPVVCDNDYCIDRLLIGTRAEVYTWRMDMGTSSDDHFSHCRLYFIVQKNQC